VALNIKNREVEELARELASRTGESKTETILQALKQRKQHLDTTTPKKKRNVIQYLERHVWPFIPPEVRGKRITKEEREEILGYGPDGV
jgi:antitoxin VapB